MSLSHLNASVTIHPEHVLGEIDRRIYGQYLEFVEPDDRTIYGAVCDHDGNLRQDVVTALNTMGVPVIRLGGNYADVYRWQDGIGPKHQRPRRVNYFWGGEESNYFGTDEFLALCERLGAQAFLNVNLGSGGLLDALAWLEYCNYPGNTDYSNLRRANGRAEPWQVPIWGIGNESWGNWEASYAPPDVYVERFNQYARYFKQLDPTVQLVAVGHMDQSWNEVVLKGFDIYPDFYSAHVYGHSFPGEPGNYEHLMAYPHIFDAQLSAVERLIAALADQPLAMVLDEWNVRHFQNGRLDRKSPRQVQDALFVADMFHMMYRHANTIKMANYVFMVNGHAPIITTDAGLITTPLFDVFKCYQDLCHSQVIRCDVQTPSFSLAKGLAVKAMCRPDAVMGKFPATLPCLDISATKNPDGSEVTAAVINRSPDTAITLALDLAAGEYGTCTLRTLRGSKPADLNFTTEDRAVNVSNGQLRDIELSPLSITFVSFTSGAAPEGNA